MLRTILLSREIIQNEEKYISDIRQIRKDLGVEKINRRILNKNIAKIEKKAFCSFKCMGEEDVESDIMSGIIISDSEAFITK